MSDTSIKATSTITWAAKSVFSVIAMVFSTLAAAGSAANAVENHRQPKEAALRKLGMEGVRFKRYY